MSVYRGVLVLVLVLAVVGFSAGCGWLGGVAGAKQLTLGYIEWDENVAVSNLTKVVLEEDLGYEVELRVTNESVVQQVFRDVASGDLNAFQDVWMPNHEQLLAEVEDDVEHLEPWYEGETSFGLAVPSYMEGVNSIADLNGSGAEKIVGIEPGAVISQKIEDNVIPDYNLTLEHEPSSTAAMLAEVEGLYKDKEPFVFPPWCPNPMCGEVSGWDAWDGTKDLGGDFDFRYLEDPKNSQGNLDEPAKISSIVNEDLADDEPVAYAFIKNLRLSDPELIALEEAQAKEGEVPGAKSWLEENKDVVQPAIDAAKKAQ